MEEKKLVPKLRFAGFEDEWIKVPAGEIFKNVSNKNHDGSLPILAVTQDKGVVPRDTIDFDIKTSEKSVKSYKIIEPGDYVISLRSFQGGIEYSYIKGICSPAYTILKPKKDIFDDFYKFYFKKEEFISRLNYAVIGIRDGKQISYKDFSEIKIPYTSVPEQKRISEFLNIIENKINLLKKEYVAYSNYKKYLMQQIFAQKLRFADYNDDWIPYKLGEILSFYSTNSFSREKLNYESGNVKNIHYGDIHTKFPTILSISGNNTVPYINDNVDLSKFKKEQYLQEGDLIIADASEDYDDIGKAIEVKDINDEKVLAGLHTILARDEKNITISGFKGYLFLTENLKTNIKRIANGISVLGISKNNLAKISVYIPTKNEQKEIVDLISIIDKKIELLNRKIKTYGKFKKGLLQQMFV